jgi:hypothetical protein
LERHTTYAKKIIKSTSFSIFDRLAKLLIDKSGKFFLCSSIVRGCIDASMATLAIAIINNIKSWR